MMQFTSLILAALLTSFVAGNPAPATPSGQPVSCTYSCHPTAAGPSSLDNTLQYPSQHEFVCEYYQPNVQHFLCGYSTLDGHFTGGYTPQCPTSAVATCSPKKRTALDDIVQARSYKPTKIRRISRLED